MKNLIFILVAIAFSSASYAEVLKKRIQKKPLPRQITSKPAVAETSYDLLNFKPTTPMAMTNSGSLPNQTALANTGGYGNSNTGSSYSPMGSSGSSGLPSLPTQSASQQGGGAGQSPIDYPSQSSGASPRPVLIANAPSGGDAMSTSTSSSSREGNFVEPVGTVQVTGYAAKPCKWDKWGGPNDSPSTVKPKSATLEGDSKVLLVAVPQRDGAAANMFGCMLRLNLDHAKMSAQEKAKMQAMLDKKTQIFAGDYYDDGSASGINSNGQMKIDMSHECSPNIKISTMEGIKVEKYACPKANSKKELRAKVEKIGKQLMSEIHYAEAHKNIGTKSASIDASQ